MAEIQNQTSEPASIAANGQNGSASQKAESDLMRVLRAESASSDEPNAPIDSPNESPETPELATESDAPGQETLPSDTEAQSNTEEVADTASAEAATSDNTELNQALDGLNDDARATLVELAKEIAEGKTSLGKLKQGHRNERKLLDRLAELEAKLDGQTETVEAIAPSSVKLPEEVAKLKDCNEIKAREQKARQAIRQLERTLRTATDGDGNYLVGETAYSADQIDRAIEVWQDELDALPERSQQLQQQSAMQAQRREFRQVFEKDYPWVKDQDSPQNQAIKEVIRRFPQFKQSAAPEYFAYVWHLGEKAAEAERVGRQNGHLTKPVATKSVGKVPAAKPHSGASASSKIEPKASFDSAFSRYKTDRSKDALNALIGSIDR